MSKKVLLDVRNLSKIFPVRKGMLKRKVGEVRAVDGISFQILEGETFGLVGESGCGKSTTGRMILRLIDNTSGEICFEGKSIQGVSGKELHELRQKMQMVFQDPYASLNPKMTVEQIISEPYEIYQIGTKEERRKWVENLLNDVGLSDYHMNRFPHEFSGGQRQRIGIARALALHPKLVVCDEPVSALDVSVRAQVLKIMQELQRKYQLSYLFISHDLSVVKHISDRIGVMYLGRLMEVGPKKQLFQNPLHPYTQALLSAIPIPNPDRPRSQIPLEGDVPSPLAPPSGCVFHPRCRFCTERCKQEVPQFRELENGHWSACHLAEQFLNDISEE